MYSLTGQKVDGEVMVLLHSKQYVRESEIQKILKKYRYDETPYTEIRRYCFIYDEVVLRGIVVPKIGLPYRAYKYIGDAPKGKKWTMFDVVEVLKKKRIWKDE